MLLNSILLLFLLHEFHVAYILLLVAVVASDGAVCLVDYVEDGLHRFVVSDALWVVAFHDSADLVGEEFSKDEKMLQNYGLTTVDRMLLQTITYNKISQ